MSVPHGTLPFFVLSFFTVNRKPLTVNNQEAYNKYYMTYAPYVVVLEFVLSAGTVKYPLNSSQQLNKPTVRLNQIVAYYDSTNDLSESGNTMASLASYTNAYLFIQDPSSTIIRQGDNLGRYLPDGKFKELIRFNYAYVDFTKSYFKYPNTTQPAADAGKSVQLYVEYIDVAVPLVQNPYPMNPADADAQFKAS